MSWLRLGFRFGALVVLTCAWFAAFCVGLPVFGPFGRRLWLRDRILFGWARSIARALAIRIRVTGQVPRGGCLVVSNHVSYADIFVLGAQRPFSFLSKAEVARWPGIGWMAWACGVQFIVREDKRSLPKVAARLRRELDDGHAILIFPEGTTSDGAAVLPFRPPLLAPAADAGLPVVHAALRYATPPGSPPASEVVCWHGDAAFLPHLLRFLRLPRIEATLRFGAEPIVERDRKQLARRLWEGVTADLAAIP